MILAFADWLKKLGAIRRFCCSTLVISNSSIAACNGGLLVGRINPTQKLALGADEVDRPCVVFSCIAATNGPRVAYLKPSDENMPIGRVQNKGTSCSLARTRW